MFEHFDLLLYLPEGFEYTVTNSLISAAEAGRPGARKFPGWPGKIMCSPETPESFSKAQKFSKISQILFLFF